MPLKDKDGVDYDALSEALQVTRVRSDELAEKWGYRINEIDTLQDEIIENYVTNSKFRLSENPTLNECAKVMDFAQGCLERIYYIEMSSMRIETKLIANRDPLMNAIKNALGSAGSEASRQAKAASAMENINLLITYELGLQKICDDGKRNAGKAWDTASRTLSAIEIDYKYNDRGLTIETMDKIKAETSTKWK